MTSFARWFALLLLLNIASSATAQSKPPISKKVDAKLACPPKKAALFRVFQALIHSNQPDWRRYGIETAHVIDRGIWRDEKNWRDADPNKIRAVVKALPADGGPVVIDIENLDLHRANTAMGANVRELDRIAGWFKTAAEGRPIGYYGLAPLGDYWRAIDYPPGGTIDWQQDNDSAASINRNADYIFPSLYTHYRDEAGWIRQAKAMVCEARRISGKPVYPFIWPEFHPGTTNEGLEVPAEFWRLQLQTLREVADGVVIWGGYDLQKNKQRQWNENSDWWRVTREELSRWQRQGRR